MKDIISAVLEILKLSIKYIGAIAIIAAILLFSPDQLLTKLGLLVFRDKYQSWIGLIFLISAVLVGIDFIEKVFKLNNKLRAKINLAKNIPQIINNLDYRERAILREFYLQGQNTIKMPIDHANVSSLISKSILKPMASFGEGTSVGMLLPLSIRDEFRDVLTYEMLGIPDNPNQEQIAQLQAQRPRFVREIEERNRFLSPYNL